MGKSSVRMILSLLSLSPSLPHSLPPPAPSLSLLSLKTHETRLNLARQPATLHACGLSPVWVRRWTIASSLRAKRLEQKSQA